MDRTLGDPHDWQFPWGWRSWSHVSHNKGKCPVPKAARGDPTSPMHTGSHPPPSIPFLSSTQSLQALEKGVKTQVGWGWELQQLPGGGKGCELLTWSAHRSSLSIPSPFPTASNTLLSHVFPPTPCTALQPSPSWLSLSFLHQGAQSRNRRMHISMCIPALQPRAIKQPQQTVQILFL